MFSFYSSSYLTLNSRLITKKPTTQHCMSLGESSISFGFYNEGIYAVNLFCHRILIWSRLPWWYISSCALVLWSWVSWLVRLMTQLQTELSEKRLTHWSGSSKNHDYNDSLLQLALDWGGMDMKRFTIVGTGIRASGLRQKTDDTTILKGVQNNVPRF